MTNDRASFPIPEGLPDPEGLSSDVNRARSLAGQAPVVQRPHRHVEVLGEFLHAQERFQSAQRGGIGLHARYVGTCSRTTPHLTERGTQGDLDAIAVELNDRPPQAPGFKTPSPALAKVMR